MLLDVAVLLGCVPLVREVLRALPSAVAASEAKMRPSRRERRAATGSDVAVGAMAAALSRLRRELSDAPPPAGQVRGRGMAGLVRRRALQLPKLFLMNRVRGQAVAGRSAQLLRMSMCAERFSREPLLPAPRLPQGAWGEVHIRPVLRLHTIAQDLLAAGATPVALELGAAGAGSGAVRRQPRRQCAAPRPPPVAPMVSILPPWAQEPLR